MQSLRCTCMCQDRLEQPSFYLHFYFALAAASYFLTLKQYARPERGYHTMTGATPPFQCPIVVVSRSDAFTSMRLYIRVCLCLNVWVCVHKLAQNTCRNTTYQFSRRSMTHWPRFHLPRLIYSISFLHFMAHLRGIHSAHTHTHISCCSGSIIVAIVWRAVTTTRVTKKKTSTNVGCQAATSSFYPLRLIPNGRPAHMH